jgi:HD-GYP domain-containing protein (c-di-GMP phosphodiesterase class II)
MAPDLLWKVFEDETPMLKIETATPGTSFWDHPVRLLRDMALAAETRDAYPSSHLDRVSAYSRVLAAAIGLPPWRVDAIGDAAPFHDIGKIGIPASILGKPGRLAADEQAVMRTHCAAGAAVLSGMPWPMAGIAERIALTHHERWDGSGYPSGLCGEAIPIEGRICAVADVLDALTSRRCYKRAWTMTQALADILTGCGSQFDPAVVEAMMDSRADLDRIQRTCAGFQSPGGWGWPAAVLRFAFRWQEAADGCVVHPARLVAA